MTLRWILVQLPCLNHCCLRLLDSCCYPTTVSRHFRNIPVNEKETLAYFIYMVKNNKSRLDQKSEGSKQLE